MLGNSAVVFVPDDRHRTGEDRPLLLRRVLGAPLLSWLAAALARDGVRRFFLVAPPEALEQARACFSADLAVTVCAEQSPADLLHVFLSTAPEEESQVTVVTGPALYLPEPETRPAHPGAARRAVCRVDRFRLMEALDQGAPVDALLVRAGEACGEEDGFFAVSSSRELPAWQKILMRNQLFRLAGQGVDIWDLDNCYVGPWVAVGTGTELLPGTILQGATHVGVGCRIGPDTCLLDTIVGDEAVVRASQAEGAEIGAGCQVGPFAHLRPGARLDREVKAGAFVEIKNTQVGCGTLISHLAYLGDSEVGRDCNIGSFVATANFDRVEKHRTTLEDRVFVGCNTSLVAPVRVGEGAYLAAGSAITQDVPTGALGVARARQVNKKDWASKHKK